ncbi:MAG: hypothetical protein WCJ81_02775 [bacterium]
MTGALLHAKSPAIEVIISRPLHKESPFFLNLLRISDVLIISENTIADDIDGLPNTDCLSLASKPPLDKRTFPRTLIFHNVFIPAAISLDTEYCVPANSIRELEEKLNIVLIAHPAWIAARAASCPDAFILPQINPIHATSSNIYPIGV